MSDEERKALEDDSFEVEELDDSQLENVAGGVAGMNQSACNESSCGTNQSQCACPPAGT